MIFIIFISVSDNVVMAVILKTSSTMHSTFHLSSTSTSFGHGSLRAGLTQSFIPHGFGSLAILPGLGCFSFSLTLITEYGNTKWCLKESPVFQAYSSLPFLWSSRISPCYSGSVTPTNTITPLFVNWDLLIEMYGESQVVILNGIPHIRGILNSQTHRSRGYNSGCEGLRKIYIRRCSPQ